MDDFSNLLQRDYGLRPQGKSAPMGASKGTHGSNFNFNPNGRSSSVHRGKPLHDADDIFRSNQSGAADFNVYDDVFGGPPKSTNPSSHSTTGYDDIFNSFSAPNSKPSSVPVYDAPVYDDDIFGGVQGVKSSSATVTYDDVFNMRSASPSPSPASFEDLLGELGKTKAPINSQPSGDETLFDDLIPGFGNTEPAKPRGNTDTKLQLPTDSPRKPSGDPFVVLEAESFSSNASSTTFHDPLEEFSMPTQSASMTDTQSFSNGTIGIDDVFDRFSQTAPSAPPPVNKSRTDRSPLKTSQSSIPQTSGNRDTVESKSVKKHFVNNLEKNHEKIYSSPPLADFDLSGGIADASIKSTLNRDDHYLREDFTSDLNQQGAPPPSKSDYVTEFVNDRWLTVDEVVLLTQPMLAPPPTRPPPPLGIKQGQSSKKSSDSKVEAYAAANFNRFSTHPQSAQSQKSSEATFDDERPSVISSIEELEDFAMGGSRGHAQGKQEIPSNGEQIDGNSAAAASAAAMKEAMEKAEAKLKQAKEARKKLREEREREATMVKTRETENQDREETSAQEAIAREEKERVERTAQEAREREEREREDQERERRRIEEREREREKDRIAVDRATKEARERAATEAREKSQRAAVERATKEARDRAAAEARERADRAAAERAAAEARERAERAAFERASAEARERAAAEARERMAAERAAVERAATEVRLRAERAAVERANAEARERAAASAERAAAAKERQRRNDNDLESFFSMGHRPNSAPKQRPATPDFASQVQNKGFSSEGPRRTPAGVPSGLRKPSQPTNMTDDFTSLFGATSSEEFQEFEGETEDRRRARLDRHQRTLERASKALAEKNERDMQAQRDQAERHRFAETLDADIKRWAAGKEGNLRALLSTLQYVLWPESGWQPVSLTDVIIASSVKKVYRKATLCVHPDKVQQKGATIQQKYIAEKVFDLLKEAWNKFNSEELF